MNHYTFSVKCYISEVLLTTLTVHGCPLELVLSKRCSATNIHSVQIIIPLLLRYIANM